MALNMAISLRMQATSETLGHLPAANNPLVEELAGEVVHDGGERVWTPRSHRDTFRRPADKVLSQRLSAISLRRISDCS
jgi:hypothetical protein